VPSSWCILNLISGPFVWFVLYYSNIKKCDVQKIQNDRTLQEIHASGCPATQLIFWAISYLLRPKTWFSWAASSPFCESKQSDTWAYFTYNLQTCSYQNLMKQLKYILFFIFYLNEKKQCLYNVFFNFSELIFWITSMVGCWGIGIIQQLLLELCEP
jgi:hypothetical protein